MAAKSSGLASLTAQYTDSEDEGTDNEMHDTAMESDDIGGTPSSSDGSRRLQIRSLVNPVQNHSPYQTAAHPGSVSPEFEIEPADDYDRPSSPISFHKTLQGMKPEEIVIPPEPVGRCSREVLAQVANLYERKLQGLDLVKVMQSRKTFRNPSIYEKLIAAQGIDEFGTNYPPEMYDPHKWEPTSYYEELREQQKQEMDRYEKEKRDKTKVEVVTGVRKQPTGSVVPSTATASGSGDGQTRKKSKWDDGPSSKATQIISSSGPIKKK